MITLNEYVNKTNRVWLELYGLSSDEKPIEKFEGSLIGNGSTLYLMDTKEIFMYSEENHTWYQI